MNDVKFYRARQALSPEILDKWLLSFHNDTELFHSIVSTVTESIITIYKSSLAKEVQNNTNILKRKLYLDINYDSVGQNPVPVISPNVIQYISQMTETFVTMKMTQENIWEDYVRWHWNISAFWAIRIMEERYGYNHMLMESKSWDKALDQIICRADANRALPQLEAYRQKIIEAFLTMINLSGKSLTEMEFLMGLDRIDSYFNKRGGKLIPERSGFLTTFSGVLYQQIRTVIGGNQFFLSFDQEWPTAKLDTAKGTLKGIAQVYPNFKNKLDYISEQEMESYKMEMRQMAREMDDETVDVLDFISHTWLKTAHHPEEMITITADDILRFRGLQEQKSGTGRRGGYKDSWRRRIAKHLSILENIRIKAEYPAIKEIISGHRLLRRQFIPETVAGGLLVISTMHSEKSHDRNLNPYIWRVRPGDYLANGLLGPGRQTALLSQNALHFDPYRQNLEKRATRYFSWQWRNRQNRELYLEPIRIRTVIEGIKMPFNYVRPSKTIERFEKMMDTLYDHKVINAWQYSDTFECWQEWLELKVIVEPPQPIIDHYLRIKTPNKNSMPSDRHKTVPLTKGFNSLTLRQERLRRGLSQMQTAEQLGINQTTLSRIECGKVQPQPQTISRIKKWLEYK